MRKRKKAVNENWCLVWVMHASLNAKFYCFHVPVNQYSQCCMVQQQHYQTLTKTSWDAEVIQGQLKRFTQLVRLESQFVGVYSQSLNIFLFLQFNSCRNEINKTVICLFSTGLGAPPPFLCFSSGTRGSTVCVTGDFTQEREEGGVGNMLHWDEEKQKGGGWMKQVCVMKSS